MTVAAAVVEEDDYEEFRDQAANGPAYVSNSGTSAHEDFIEWDLWNTWYRPLDENRSPSVSSMSLNVAAANVAPNYDATDESTRSVVNPVPVDRIRAACSINGRNLHAMVDTGAERSLIDLEFAKSLHLKMTPAKGVIHLAAEGKGIPRQGFVVVTLKLNQTSHIAVMEVLKLQSEKAILGMDVMAPIGIRIQGVPHLWPTEAEADLLEDDEQEEDDTPPDYPPGVSAEGIDPRWLEVLAAQAAIPKTSVCSLPNSTLRLDMLDEEPVYVHQYPTPIAYQGVVQNQVDEWLNDDIIEVQPDYNCPWNFPLTASHKPKCKGMEPSLDTVRICFDYRMGNKKLKPLPGNSLPKIRTVLERLKNFEYLSMLDAKGMYTQYLIAEEHRDRTTFTVGGKRYRFKRGIWGIATMTEFAQSQMMKLFQNDDILPFLDDDFISTTKGEDHGARVLRILERVTYDANLRLNLKKCKFFQKKALVLGYICTPNGIRVDPLKSDAIRNWPLPKNGIAIMRFLGAVNFHRDFDANFAAYCAKLDALRSLKTKPITWTPDLVECFEKVKDMFIQQMELLYFDSSKTTYLTSDACDTAIAAWIGQMDDKGRIRPVMCVSKKLDQTQQRWSTTKKELYANMWSMYKLRHYLHGRLFINRVDHKAMEKMLVNAPNHLIQGWMDNILSFNFITEYFRGEDNVLADALSRKWDGHMDHFPRHGNFAVSATTTDAEIAVPENERTLLMEREHLLGHFSAETMLKKLRADRKYWPSMRKDVTTYVAGCIPCAKYNSRSRGYHPLSPISALSPWDHIEMDLIGPFPMSDSGYIYILHVVDVLTNFSLIRPIKTKEAHEVAEELWKIICDFGPPKVLQSDNGTEFVNSVISAITSLTGIDHRLITAYHPTC